ncbi:MAG: MBL fold metallo-hydrolase, partial [Syntrophomonadaceae bacterium]|nr:MBL fold metallo-hydrolase [Syntrophomonadaceae bacterium]
MRIQFLGAARTVTGSCFLIETRNHRFLVECGMFQGGRAVRERNNQPFLFEPGRIDFVLLTHAHIDHSGLLPRLYRFGYRGPIYCTEPTADLCEVMLLDSAHIQEMESERGNRKRQRAGQSQQQPLYTVEDAENCARLFKRVNYNETISFGEGLTARFQDAGHILGSA